MLQIYHSPGTRGYRAIWACEELNAPYEVIPTSFAAQFRASSEWREKSPVGKLPIMTDGDMLMFESGAMVQYILDKHGKGKLQPVPGTAQHALYLQWGWFAESTFARPLGEVVNHRRVFGDDGIAAVTDEMKSRARVCLAAVDEALQGKRYLLGEDFSGADIMMAYTLRIYRRLVDEDFPDDAARYWADLMERPACKATEEADAAAVA
ncbi:MAG: glutathione S-transferase family protein [Gammaproteobacteria bacterium]|nr:glutathione S-transferase family protein [Gammaproteobacteria bacterium]